MDCADGLERQVGEWKAIGGPYYLHSDYQLVHLLYKVRPIDSKAVHLCNLMLRMVEETTITDYPTAEQKAQMQCWYIELINRLGQYTSEGPQIQHIMYRHAAPYLI
ncbi:MAG: hypothetical protein EOP45_09905 [Sphingobacteriaceae bacterium]|nr:MAG: hypothetical protein EOP45_09905 [Sphingobacteriaceae bacterium]